MTTYNAPVDEMMFLFDNLKDNKNYNEIDKLKEINSDLVKDILVEAAKINKEIILPLAKTGDETPCVYENGIVRSPPGYKEAYKKFIADGWTSLSCDPRYGGQGMPKTVPGLGVKTLKLRSYEPSIIRANSTPSLRPIQFSCMERTRSGQSSPSKSSSSSAYLVMRSFH